MGEGNQKEDVERLCALWEWVLEFRRFLQRGIGMLEKELDSDISDLLAYPHYHKSIKIRLEEFRAVSEQFERKLSDRACYTKRTEPPWIPFRDHTGVEPQTTEIIRSYTQDARDNKHPVLDVRPKNINWSGLGIAVSMITILLELPAHHRHNRSVLSRQREAPRGELSEDFWGTVVHLVRSAHLRCNALDSRQFEDDIMRAKQAALARGFLYKLTPDDELWRQKIIKTLESDKIRRTRAGKVRKGSTGKKREEFKNKHGGKVNAAICAVSELTGAGESTVRQSYNQWKKFINRGYGQKERAQENAAEPRRRQDK